MATFPEALPARQAARRRWQVVLIVLFCVGAAGGLVAVASEFLTLPDAVMWVALVALAGSVAGVFVSAFGLGWTAGLRWYQSVRWAFKMACSAIFDHG